MEHNHQLRRVINSGPAAIAAAALSLFGLIATTVTVVAIIESYSNLLAFARVHGLTGWRLAIAPAAVDSFIVMGELLLFAAILLAWRGKSAYWLGGGMAVWGFLLSVGGNVWHASAASVTDRGVAAVWPVTATAGMAGGLIIIKRVMAGRSGSGVTVAPAAAVREPPPVPRPRREPRQPARPARAARPADLAAASAHERQVMLRLLELPAGALPGRRTLAVTDFGGSIRKAERVLALVRAGMNGAGSGDVNGS
jgi:hypothetical protein